MKNIAILGTGKVGSAFAVELYSIGYKISALADTDINRAKKLGKAVKCYDVFGKVNSKFLVNADIVVVSVNDDNLAESVFEISDHVKNIKTVVFFHTSGIHSSLVFDKKFFDRKYTASVHPIQSIESISYKNKGYLNNVYFGIEGGHEALKLLKKLIADLKSKPVHIKPDVKTDYHLSCVLASNFLTANFCIIEEISKSLGIKKEMLVNILSVLTENTLKNIKRKGTGKSLTGPVERGDKETILKHIGLLYGNYPEFLEYYINGSRILAGISAYDNKKTKED
ncbi:MAG: DUF2520 domain-containing protein, partial [Ignavibacteria bacterium]|nr:DUF2520 domain-containing protein [Ignavibacteria bacterium]